MCYSGNCSMEDYNGICTIEYDSLALAYCHDHNSTCYYDTIMKANFKNLYSVRQQLASYVDTKSGEFNIQNHFYIYAIGNDGYKNLLYVSKNFPFAIYHVYNLHLYHEPCFYQSHILNVSGLGNMYGTYSEAKKLYIRNHGI